MVAATRSVVAPITGQKHHPSAAYSISGDMRRQGTQPAVTIVAAWIRGGQGVGLHRVGQRRCANKLCRLPSTQNSGSESGAASTQSTGKR